MEAKANAPAPTVGEFMTRELCTADASLPLADALQRMTLNRIRHLAIVDEGRLVGVVSSRDLGFASGFSGVDPAKTEVRHAVTGTPQVCAPDAPVSEVARAMEEHRFGCILVVEDSAAIGIFTTTDALRALRQLATGMVAERLNPPTHVVQRDSNACHVAHVRAGDRVRMRGAMPSPNDGKFGGNPI